MATQIKLRRDTYQNWFDNNPILAEGEPGYDLTNKKLKIGDGVTLWRALPYFDDQQTDLSSYAGNIVPDADNTRDLGAPDKQWRHVYTSGGSIYLDNIKLTNVGGKFVAKTVINPGEENEADDPEDSDATSEISSSSDTLTHSASGNTATIGTNAFQLNIDNADGSDIQYSFNSQGKMTLTPGEESYTDAGIEVVGNSYSISAVTSVSLQTANSDPNPATANNATFSIGKNGGSINLTRSGVSGWNRNWSFDTDGNLTLPVGGDILDSTGVSVLGSSGSITVGNGVGTSVSNVTEILINGTITEIEPGLVGISVSGGTTSDQNIWIQTFESDNPNDIPGSATSVEYDSDGNIIALFVHYYSDNSGNNYTSLAKFTSTGTKLWQVRYAGIGAVDGWGVAVDSQNSFIYVSARLTDPSGYDKTTITQFNLANGSINWSKIYDFGYASTSGVIDAYNGDAVFVGYANTATDNQVIVVKIAGEDGTIYWANGLDGQGSDEAYGMAIGPSGEVAVIGYMSQLGVVDRAATLYADNNPNWTGGSLGATSNGVTFSVTVTAGVATFSNISDTIGNRSVDEVIDTINGSVFGGVDGVDDMVVKVGSLAANELDDRMLVAKYNSDGTLAWQKAVLFDTGFDCQGADADIDSLGNIYVVGQYQKDDGQGGTDTAMNLVKFNSSGTAQWSRRVVGDCDTFAASVVVGPDDYLYLSGIAGNISTSDFSCVVAKYQQNGQVAWQRLLDNVTTWSFAGGFYVANGGGSSIAVKNGYVAVSGGFGDPGRPVHAMIAQFDTAGTMFTVGNWDFKQASFSGLLSSDASDIIETNANKENIDLYSDITVSTFSPDVDTTNFLVPTIYRQGDASTGDITFSGVDIQGATTNNILGSISLVPNPALKDDGQYLEIYPTTANDAPHIHLAAGTGPTGTPGDLILGNDNYHVDVNHTGEVKIRAYDSDTSTTYNWQFENDGTLILPNTGVIRVAEGTGTSQFKTVLGVTHSDTRTTSNWTSATYIAESGGGKIEIVDPTPSFRQYLALRLDQSVTTTIQINGNILLTYGYVDTSPLDRVYLYVNEAPATDPTTVTDIVISTVAENYVRASDQDNRLDFISGSGWTVNIESKWTGDINIKAGDDILLKAGDKQRNDSTGGDIDIRAGSGGNSDHDDVGGVGGSIDIEGGFGGIASTYYNANNGGSVNIRSGTGGDANTAGSKLAGSGADLNLYAGQGGYTYGDPTLGNSGGDVNIYAGDSTNDTAGGDILIQAGVGGATTGGGAITLRTKTTDNADRTWVFDNQGKTTLPGAVIKGTVAKTGVAPASIGSGQIATVTPSATNNPALTPGIYADITLTVGTYFTVTVTVITGGDITVEVTASGAGFQIGDTGMVPGSVIGGTTGVDDIVLTVATLTNIVQGTAIDLTKSVNKLTDGVYSLADGVEGQIVYLVPQTGTVPSDVNVNVANYRIDGSAGTDGLLFPFRIFNGANATYFDSGAFCTLIFTDGAWQQSGGSWD